MLKNKLINLTGITKCYRILMKKQLVLHLICFNKLSCISYYSLLRLCHLLQAKNFNIFLHFSIELIFNSVTQKHHYCYNCYLCFCSYYYFYYCFLSSHYYDFVVYGSRGDSSVAQIIVTLTAGSAL